MHPAKNFSQYQIDFRVEVQILNIIVSFDDDNFLFVFLRVLKPEIQTMKAR